MAMVRNEELERKIATSGEFKESAQSAWVTSTYPIRSVQWCGSSPFCSELVLAESPTYGRFLATDGELQSTQSDETIYHEHLVHPAIIAYRALYGEKPLRVLVLGAGEGATIRELVRYSRDSVSYIMWNDIDEHLVNLCDEHLGYVSKDSPLYDQVCVCVCACTYIYIPASLHVSLFVSLSHALILSPSPPLSPILGWILRLGLSAAGPVAPVQPGARKPCGRTPAPRSG